MSNKYIKQLLLIAGIFVISFSIFCINILKKDKEKTLNNPPTIYYVEEDAESYLYSVLIKVYKVEKIDDNIMMYFVKDCDTDTYYKVIYKCKFREFSYRWEYSHYIPILNMVKERKTTNENNIQ